MRDRLFPYVLILYVVLISFAITGVLTACTASTPIVAKPDPCGGWTAIIPDSKDALTTDTANQILAHDCRGYKLKCWNPSGIAEACASASKSTAVEPASK